MKIFICFAFQVTFLELLKYWTVIRHMFWYLNRYYSIFLPVSGAGSWSMLQKCHARVDHQTYPQTLCSVANFVDTTDKVAQFHRSGPGTFPCPGCTKLYRHKRNMLSHFRLECGQIPQLRCHYCSYSSKRTYDLKRHIRNRHKEKF